MKDHFIIVAGHLDTKYKEKIALDFFDELSKLKNVKLCYCTHFENIPKKIYNIFDYVAYDKNNPILNWDLKNSASEGFVLETLVDKDKIVYHVPYHGYAHFLSMCAGMSLGISQGYDKFSFLNYDIKHELLKELSNNIQKINEFDIDGIHYEYEDKLTKTNSLNTEFFTFNLKYAQTYLRYSSFENYSSFGTIILERIFAHISLKNNLKIALHSKKIPDNSLGKIKFGKGDDGYASQLKYFVPYESIIHNDKSYNFILVPFKNKNKYNFFSMPLFESKDFKSFDKIKLTIDNNQINFFDIVEIEKNSNLKFSFDNKIIREYKFDNEKHFGFIT